MAPGGAEAMCVKKSLIDDDLTHLRLSGNPWLTTFLNFLYRSLRRRKGLLDFARARPLLHAASCWALIPDHRVYDDHLTWCGSTCPV